MTPRILLSVLALSALPVFAQPSLRVNGVEANYTTTKFFIDEVRGDTQTVVIEFRPNEANLTAVEIFTNLDRRDRASLDANSDGIPDGILPPDGTQILAGNDNHYYKAYSMADGGGGLFTLNLPASKTGAYRLTGRWKVQGDNNWRWYSSAGRRDHAIVVSPIVARDIRMYELNVFNMEAGGTLFSQRSTLEDLSDRPGRIHTNPARANQFNLGYLQGLGINWIWFQPYHPYGWEGRHLSAKNINDRAPGANASTWRWNGGSPSEDENYPFALGSPYAVRNFWEVEPRMTASFVGDPNSESDVAHPDNRARAMTAFQNFAQDADSAGINLMPDAAFNHTAWDVELGQPGVDNWMAAQGASGWSPTDFIRSRELRVFSRKFDYAQRATYYNNFFDNNIAPAPDRGDFGKWLDVCDIFFGRYAALVNQNPADNGNYANEGDWFNYDAVNGNFDAVTRATWNYFARYAPYWLEKTRPSGQNRNSSTESGLTAEQRYAWDARGIDGLRCDFGQGLPPQAWEYIINVARSHKWSFVFMAETLDGGAPPYRSNRHFDILNENILFAVKGTNSTSGFRGIFEERRNAFGQGLVLLNTVSHDEDNYSDPWIALRNFAVMSSVDGAPMIFPGQELGISTFFGYDLMEKNFGKYIPHFKTYNSMMPLWANTDFGNDQLYPVYAAINRARAQSPALRSSNRFFLDRVAFQGAQPNLWSAAKFEERNASPNLKDVVFAFVNLDRSFTQGGTFWIAQDTDSNGVNDYGIQPNRQYNVRNIAAYTAIDSTRNQIWIWGTPKSGADLLANGLGVVMNPVPAAPAGWATNPYEAQFLKLQDVTMPDQMAPPSIYTSVQWPYQLLTSSQGPYQLVAGTVTVQWVPQADPLGGVKGFYYQIGTSSGGNDIAEGFTTATSVTFTAAAGTTVFARVQQVSLADVYGPYSNPTAGHVVLNAVGDDDGDGQSNTAELLAGTDALNAASRLQITSAASAVGGGFTISFPSVNGRNYRIQRATTLGNPTSWVNVATGLAGNGAVLTHTDTAGTPPVFYRVVVEQ